MASKIHKERTGKGLKISEEIVSKEEMYEEEDDIPSFYRFAGSLPFPPRFQAYASLQSGLHNIAAADANHQRVHSAFAQAFPHLNGTPQQNVFAQPAQSPVSLMSGNPSAVDSTFPGSQPVSPRTAMINPTSPAAVSQGHPFSPAALSHHIPSPMASVHTPMVTPPADSPNSHGFFGAHAVASSPMSCVGNGSFSAASPSGMPTPNPRSISISSSGEHRSSSIERSAVSATSQSFPHGWAPLQTSEGWPTADWDWHSLPMFEEVNSEPPPKRRRSQPMIRDQGHHAHTPSFAATGYSNVAQQHSATFTTKLPGSLQTLYHKSTDDKDVIAMGNPSAISFQQQSIVLQNPPPPRTKLSSSTRIKTETPIRIASAETSPTIPEEDEASDHSHDVDSGRIGSPHDSEVAFAFDATPGAPELLGDQNGTHHDDLELTHMLEQPATFQFDALTQEGSDDQFGSWEDMLNIPASQPDNDEES